MMTVQYGIIKFYIPAFFFQENLEMVIKNGHHKLVSFAALVATHDHVKKKKKT